MSSVEGKVEIRPITFQDIDAISLVEKKIRAAGKTITYANLTTEQIFSKRIEIGTISRLFDFGFVAEVDGQVCGFILGELAHLRESAIELCVILIIGVLPDYQQKGIAAKLVDAVAERCRAKGITRMRIGIDERDKDLITFIEHLGFRVGRLLIYSKIL
jgi:GNAT superfamily N-acetyltransferase